MQTVDLNLDPGQTIDGVYDVTVAVDSVVSKVRFMVDGVQVSEDIGYPWTYRWDTRSVTDADHTLEVRVLRRGRVIGRRSVTVTVNNSGGGGGATVNMTGTWVGQGLLAGLPSVTSGGSALTAYWGARIDGTFYSDHYSSPVSTDAPQTGSFGASNLPWDLFEAHAGKRVTCVHTGTGGNNWPPNPYSTSQANNARSRGAFLNYSFGTTATGLNNILNPGSAGSAIWTSLGNWFKTVVNHGHPILFRPFWEMNLGARFPWSSDFLTDTQFLTLWRNVWQACADTVAGATPGSGVGTDTANVSFFWCPNVINAGDPTGQYPGEDYVDWLGWDGYAANTTYESPASRFNSTYALLETLDATKPFFIGETGCNPDIGSPGKAAWITDFLGTWLPAHDRVKGFSWFNEYGSPNLPHIEVGDGAANFGSTAQAAWQAAISAPYFKDNIVDATTFPSGAKVPIPAGSGSAVGVENSAEGGSNGTTVTVGNSGGGSGDAFSAVTGPGVAGVLQFSNAHPAHGSLGIRYATRGTSEACWVAWDNGVAIDEAYGRTYVLYDTITATTRVIQWRIGSVSTVLAYLNLTSAGAVQLRNGTDAATSWAGPSLTANTLYRIEWYISHPASGASTMQIKVYAGDGGTVVTSGDSGSVTGITNGGSTGGIGYVRYGQASATTNVPSTTGFVYLDDLSAFQTTWPGVGP